MQYLLTYMCLLSILSLHATSAQDLSVGPGNADVAIGAFSGRRDFERFCTYNGAQSQLNALQWLLNGTVHISTETTRLQLLIRPVNFSHAGNWTCRAVYNNGSSEEVYGGYVFVFDPNDVIVPPKQYALIGQPYTFNCSSVIPNQMSFVSWLRSGETGSILDLLITSSAQLSDEGVYICRVSVLDTSFEMPVQVGVVVPPVILSFPSLSGQIFTNEPVTLTVNFKSHTQEITSVRWFKNDVRITSDDINTTYGASPNATTQLEFTQIARQNRGTYRVEIENSADVIPSNMRTVATTFNVNVQVPPSLPENVMFTPFNDTHVMITWTLTNQTPDAGAEMLTLHLENHPNSPFVLEPTQNEWILYSEPGMSYLLSLKASNPDGMVTTTPMTVTLPAKAPRVESFRALRVNSTSFNLTLSVIYTGGGDIETFAVSFQEPGSNQMTEATLEIPLQSQTKSNLWYAVVTNTLFASIEEPEFEVNIRNTMGQSTVQPLVGESVLPGPPNILLVSKSSNMLDLRIEISYIGTAPITMVRMNVTTATSSQIIRSFEQGGNYIQGQLIDASVMNLEPSTTYICRARAMNSIGTGNPSMEFEFVTEPGSNETGNNVGAIIGGCVGTTVVLLLVVSVVLTALLITYKRHLQRQDDHVYDEPGAVANTVPPAELRMEHNPAYVSSIHQ